MWNSTFVTVILAHVIILIAGETIATVPEAGVLTQSNQAPSDTRGLFQDLYLKNVQGNKPSSPATQYVSLSGSESTTDEDVGEKFTLAVVKTAVALAETGIQTAQEIIKTVGSELAEAFKMKRQETSYL